MDLELIHKYLADECSEEQRKAIEQWINKNEHNRQHFLRVKKIWQAPLQEPVEVSLDDAINLDSEWNELEQKMSSSGKNSKADERTTSHDHFKHRNKLDLKPAFSTAAAIILMAICGWWIYPDLQKSPEPPKKEVISKANHHTRFELSDGTRVTLNASSRVRLPEKFTGDQRKIFMEGEAFFEVTSDSLHPFIVEVNGARIKVLGTKFNVKAPAASEEIQVAVQEGKVLVQNEEQEDGANIVLTKGNLGVYNIKTENFVVEKTRISNYLSWMTGRLVFKNKALLEVSRQLERLYDVEIQFEDEVLKSRKLSADFEKKSLKPTLDIISATLGIAYQISENTVVWQANQ